jgi:hypothetical protein
MNIDDADKWHLDDSQKGYHRDVSRTTLSGDEFS